MVERHGHHPADRGDDAQKGGNDNLQAFQTPTRNADFRVDAQTFGDKTGPINDHFMRLANVEAQPTVAGDRNAQGYDAYKKELTAAVFNDQGAVRPEATTENIKALMALNAAEIAAVRERKTSIVAAADSAATMNNLGNVGGRGNIAPMRETATV